MIIAEECNSAMRNPLSYRLIKRSLDLFVAGAVLLLTLPILLVITVIVRRDGSPALYKSPRAGLRGIPFGMFKFRTMVPNADSIGPSSTPDDDPRVTRFGALLRRYKMDELPQLINVLLGQMSLVGPRPQVLHEVALYGEEERLLLSVHPGITDYASIQFRNEGQILRGSDDPNETYNRLIRPGKTRLGLLYIARRSITTDLKILLLTLVAVVNQPLALRFIPNDHDEAGYTRLQYSPQADSSITLSQSSVRRAYVSTGLVVLTALAESIIGLKIVAHRFGVAAFAQYSISLRVLGMLQTPLLIGTGIGIPRLLARLPLEERRRQAGGFLAAGLITVALSLSVFAASGLILAWPLSHLIFGPSGQSSLAMGLVVLVIGSCVHAVVFAFARGSFSILKANVLFLWGLAIAPLLAVIVSPSVPAVLALTGALNIVGSLLLVIASRPNVRGVNRRIRELFDFGFRRVPGEFMLFGLLAVPPILAAHSLSLTETGVFTLGTSLLGGVGALFSPISLILLPYASELLARGRLPELKSHADKLLIRTVLFTSAGTIVIEFLAPFGVRLFLGAGYSGAVASFRWAVATTPLYASYVALRSIIDAYHYRAVTMRNAAISFIVSLGAGLITLRLEKAVAAEIALGLGVATLSALTMWESRRILRGSAVPLGR